MENQETKAAEDRGVARFVLILLFIGKFLSKEVKPFVKSHIEIRKGRSLLFLSFATP